MEFIKVIQLGIIFSFGLYFTFVSFENIVNYDVNFGFVKHVLSMDTTFGLSTWKAIGEENSGLYHVTYIMIIVGEITIASLCWLGFAQMIKNFKSNFNRAKQYGILGIGLGMLLFVLFLVIGGEWFLMWESSLWNGQDKAFNMSIVLGVIDLLRNYKQNLTF